jgi:HSP20 family protein
VRASGAKGLPVPNERDAPRSTRIDILENDTAYDVHADVRGVSKEDIQVAIEGNQVTITAEVKRAREPHGQRTRCAVYSSSMLSRK